MKVNYKHNKLLMYFLSCCLMITTLLGGLPVLAATHNITVHFKSTWGAAKIYTWAPNTAVGDVTWPGVDMIAEEDDWYTYTIDREATNLIFNDGGTQKTGDLYITAGEWWYKDGVFTSYNPEIVADQEIIVHYKSTSGDATIYYWNTAGGDGTTVSWPGVAMTSEGNDWYTYSLTGYSTNIIFSNSGNNKTDDLTCDSGEWWYKDGKWYSCNPESSEPTPTPTPTPTPIDNPIKVHYYSDAQPTIYYWATDTQLDAVTWPGVAMTSEGDNWYAYTINATSTKIIFSQSGNKQTADLSRTSGEWWYKNGKWYSEKPIDQKPIDPDQPIYVTPENIDNYADDFREETIYFVMTTRFYDGDPNNNVHCWDDVQAGNPDSDPAWRGDFKGLIEKLDYIKALGFSAIWITPVVENASGYDYHGYHAIDHSKVDSRYESEGATYQDLIDACHEKGMKIIQDVVFNHTGNFGEANLLPLFEKQAGSDLGTSDCLVDVSNGLLPEDYADLTPAQQYQARLAAMKTDEQDVNAIYHHEQSLSWEGYTVQTGQIAGDCVDLNTENLNVSNYLVDCYSNYLDMGVDAFRLDTVKHISRLSLNNNFIPQLFAAAQEAGNDDFFMFGEIASRYRQVWNNGIPNVSTPFYTWKEQQEYPWSTLSERTNSVATFWGDNTSVDNQPTSDNHLLYGNSYHTPDWSQRSGLDVIDFPMHWNFNNARDSFSVAVGNDHYYNDATFNVTYVDSHDYAPDGAPENQRFAGSQDTWAENLNLMFTFRGIPTIYYGSEIEFMKGAPIDVGPNKPLSETGRAYFGDNIEGSISVSDFGVYSNATGAIKTTLEHPLAQHIRRLNLIRRAVPALQKGQYSTADISGNMAFKRCYNEDGIYSFALVTITDGATFNNIPNGTYTEVITGAKVNVTNGTLSAPNTGKGNMRVYVLDTASSNVTGKIGENGAYLK